MAILSESYNLDGGIPEYDPEDPQTWIPHDGISYDPLTGEPKLTWDDTEPNPFTKLPNERLLDIFARVGPQGRTSCWSVNVPSGISWTALKALSDKAVMAGRICFLFLALSR